MNDQRQSLFLPSSVVQSNTAIIDGDITLDYDDLRAAIAGTARRLRENGVATSDRVGIYLQPDWRYLVLLLASISAGIVINPLNTHLPMPAIKAHLDQIKTTKLLATASMSTPEELSGIQIIEAGDVIDKSQVPYEDIAIPQVPLNQAATIIFTSGSTGRPKAVLHTFGNHYWSALGSNENIRLSPGDRWLLSLPLYHVSGLSILFRCMVSGATVVVPPPELNLEEAIECYGITHISMVSTQLLRMMQSETGLRLLGKLRAILLGGSAMPRAALDEAYARNLPIYVSYGLSEMASQITTTPSPTPPDKRYTSGRLLPYREIKVGDDGQILVKGKTLFAGYVEGSEVVILIDEDGWFRTGDLGQIDTDGYLTVIGRRDNMFISGGENIQPEEIEAALLQIPDIEQVVVVPVSNVEWGFRSAAFVKLKQGELNSQALRPLLESRLPRFKIPSVFYPWPAELFPQGFKVSRAAFRALAESLIQGTKEQTSH
jgi:O-succinylbenzoic acid--CoA ligase